LFGAPEGFDAALIGELVDGTLTVAGKFIGNLMPEIGGGFLPAGDNRITAAFTLRTLSCGPESRVHRYHPRISGRQAYTGNWNGNFKYLWLDFGERNVSVAPPRCWHDRRPLLCASHSRSTE
jgi:hypothetical protein